MMTVDSLGTERLQLAAVTHAYSRDIFENFTESVTRYMYPAALRTKEEADAFIQSCLVERQKGISYTFAVTLKTSGEFLGIVALHLVDSSLPEVGVWIKEQAQGRGYGREAVGAVIALAANLGIAKLKYPVDRRILASRKLALGYGGRLVRESVDVRTPDGRVLQEEVYEIELSEQNSRKKLSNK